MNKYTVIGMSLFLSILFYWLGDMIIGGFFGGAYINYGFPIPYKRITLLEGELIYHLPLIIIIDLLIFFIPLYLLLNRLLIRKAHR